MFAAMAVNTQRKESGPSTSPLRASSSEEPNLSEINPLFNPLELDNGNSVNAFKSVTLSLIDRYGGLRPDILKSMLVTSNSPNINPQYRLIARFEVSGLTKSRIKHLEELVRYIYGSDTRTTKNSDGVELPATRYPHADVRTIDEAVNTRLEGWYMGPNTTDLDTLHQGVYLYKDVGVTNARNFLKASQAKNPRYLVEIREAGLHQTDLASLVVETAAILGTGKPVDYGQLIYDSYYELIRSGLKRNEAGFGIEDILRPVRRGLIYPLTNPELAAAIGQEPESAILCGVPGTGKSLAAQQLLQENTGAFLIPMDPIQVAQDIALAPEKRKIIPRITQVRRLSGRPVILQLDDVEKLFDKGNNTSSALLNLMAGVQEQGFYVLASTNEPEQIDSALLQPQRLGIRVYCGLPNEQARLHILDIHTPHQTPETGSQLFSSEGVRSLILGYVARNTDNLPPRQLGKIVTEAQALFMERVVRENGKVRGLTEANLNGATFRIEDWEDALANTLATFDRRATVKRDTDIRDFVIKQDRGQMGLVQTQTRVGHDFEEVREQIAAAEAGGTIISA